jgi:hypothetical protein
MSGTLPCEANSTPFRVETQIKITNLVPAMIVFPFPLCRVLESCLRDIYRALKLRLSIEQDEVTLTHISLALDEIDSIVRQLFTPNPTLQKKIYVLDAPPDL